MVSSNLLSEVPSGNYFAFPDGRLAKNLEELFMIISTSDAAVFLEHVNDSKNDFANWIRSCVLHVALADRLDTVKNRDEYLRIMGGEIQNLKTGKPATVDDGLDSIDAELNSVLDEEILAAMNDESPSGVPVPTDKPLTSPPIVAAKIEAIIPAPKKHQEESYEYEEVFKPLVDEITNKMFTWE